MDSSRGPAGVVFLDFTLQIWGRGFDRGSAGVALILADASSRFGSPRWVRFNFACPWRLAGS